MNLAKGGHASVVPSGLVEAGTESAVVWIQSGGLLLWTARAGGAFSSQSHACLFRVREHLSKRDDVLADLLA